MSQTTFDRAQAFCAKWEDGFVDHPKDPGGATNFGVSLRWLRDDGIDVDGDRKIDINDIRNLTPELAAQLFRKHFWDKLKLSDLPPLTAIVTYDAAVNTGKGQAVKFLQRACNMFPGVKLVDDGIIGPATRARVVVIDDRTLANKCVDMREVFHNQLATNSPYSDGRDYRPFIKGWLNRTADLRRFVNGL